MGRVNSQRENGPKERENGLRAGYGGQQPWAKNPLVSRDFSRKTAVGETVATSDSWRRDRNCRRTLSAAFSMSYELHKLRWMLPGESRPAVRVSARQRGRRAGARPATWTSRHLARSAKTMLAPAARSLTVLDTRTWPGPARAWSMPFATHPHRNDGPFSGDLPPRPATARRMDVHASRRGPLQSLSRPPPHVPSAAASRFSGSSLKSCGSRSSARRPRSAACPPPGRACLRPAAWHRPPPCRRPA
jgi:hypothetical protein